MVKIEGEIDKAVDAFFGNLFAFLQHRLVLGELFLRQCLYTGRIVVELFHVLVGCYDLTHLREVCGHIRDEDLIIDISKGIAIPDADSIKNLLHLFRIHRETDPLSDKLSLVVLIQIGDKRPHRKIVHWILHSFLLLFGFSLRKLQAERRFPVIDGHQKIRLKGFPGLC